MSTNGGGARDAAARRRRIAERGAERLALITGRVQSISSSSPLVPPVAQPQYSSTAPCPPSISQSSDQVPSSDENTDSPLTTEMTDNDVESDIQPVLPKYETITETHPQPSFKPTEAPFPATLTEPSPPISTSNKSLKPEPYPQTSFKPTNNTPFPTTLTEPNPPISTSNKSNKPRPQTHLQETLSPNRIRPAITSSEYTRRNCSVLTALLVIFSYAGFPILGSDIIKSIILFRPLILLLLTNITIVAAPLLLEKTEQRDHRGSGIGIGETGFVNHLGMALEWGMLMKTGLTALFMDCSVYSVVVICGMSFLRKFGW